MRLRLFSLTVPLLLWLLAALVLAGCPSGSTVEQYKAENVPCPRRDLTVPCKIGPDGLLYRIDPDE